MKTHVSFVSILSVLLAFCIFNLKPTAAFAQGSAFTYQGQLQTNGIPVHGTYNLQFSLFTVATGGTAVAGPATTNGVVITNGFFAVTIDFGSSVWNGATNWLQIAVESNGASSFTSLTPRQRVTPTPYAIFAEGANAAGLIGTVPVSQLPAGIVTNNQGTVTVSNLELAGTSVVIYIGTNTLIVADTNSDLFVGPGAGNLTCTPLSFGNTASGVGAMPNIVETVYNTANGYQALYSDIGGSDDTAYGAFALYSDTNGYGNTACGYYTLESDTSGGYNTAVGFQAGGCYTNSDNTAIGALALWSNWGGSGNTADGTSALQSDTTGANNTAVGFDALFSDNFGSQNTAVGDDALYNNTFASYNTATGVQALFGNVGGEFDTADGYQALQNNYEGSFNTADGYLALGLNSSGYEDTAAGAYALEDNNSGYYDTAVGYQALESNTNGLENTAIGDDALFDNLSGDDNTACGYGALFANTTGLGNAALGGALTANTTGDFNTAAGGFSLSDNKSGSYNTSIGFEALESLGTTTGVGGSSNIAVGCISGSAFTGNESNNIDIGNIGVLGESGVIRIGTAGQQKSTYLVGNVYTPNGSVESSSDRNAKEDFAPVNPQQVLAKVAALPVTEWNYKTDEGVEHMGPMAQDFHAAFGLNGVDDKHISVVDEGGVAFAAIQGLNQKLQEQQAENSQLRQELNELKAEVKSLEQMKGDNR